MQLSQDAQKRTLEWLANGDTGLSSMTIAFHALDVDFNNACEPLDPSDFYRCKQLIEAVPEIKPFVYTLHGRYPWIQELCLRWDEIDSAFQKELHQTRPVETHKLLREVSDQISKIQKAIARTRLS